MRLIVMAIFALWLLSSCSSEDSNSYTPKAIDDNKTLYIFSIHPYLNPIETSRVYDPLMRYLEKRIPGARFQLDSSNNYEHFEQKLVNGLPDFALPNPYHTVIFAKQQYTVIAKMKPDDDFRGIIVARKDRRWHTAKELKGQTLSFPAPTALAATMMPLMLLHDKGVDVIHGINKKFVGSQKSAILNAYTGDSAAACTWPLPWRDWVLQNPDKAKEMEVVWQTKTLPNNSVMVHARIPKPIAQQVAHLLATLDTTPEGRAIIAAIKSGGFELANNTTYEPVRLFLKRYQTLFGLPLK